MEPTAFTAGTSSSWSRADDYAYGLWTFEYLFTGPEQKTLEAAADGGAVVATIAASDSWTDGKYQWSLFRSKDSERVLVATGYLVVYPDPAGQTGTVDHRSHAEKMLAAIEAKLEGRISSDHESYTIDGRSLNRIPVEQLVQYRQRYRNEVAREQRKNSNKAAPRRVIWQMK
jgi:hypothetical protein